MGRDVGEQGGHAGVRALSFGRAWALVVAVLTALWLAAPQGAQAQTYIFTSIDVQGATRIEPATIIDYAGIARGQTVSGGELNAAYQRVLGSGLFETVEFVPSGRLLVIRVNEFPTINRINIEGNRRLDDEELLPLVQSSVRRVYSPATAEQDAQRIVDAYLQRGRLAANVEPVIIRRSNNRVDLVFEVKEGKIVEVERISFVGNRQFSDSRLRRVLESKQAGLLRFIIQRDTFVAERLEFDKQVLRDFYLSRGYVDFVVLSVNTEFSRDRGAFFVTFNVREGQSFDIGNVTVVSEVPGLSPADFRREVRLRRGQTYSPQAVDLTITRLERLAVRKDLDFIRVEPRITRDERNLILNIELAIVRGPRIFVERIDIEGNATTLDRVIRRQFRTAEGDPFNPREIRDAAERIRALGFFSQADIEAREGSTTDQVIIDVDVEEQPTGSLGFGATYSASTGAGLTVTFTERNFLGRGQTLSFEISTSEDNRQYSFNFIEPGFLDRDLRFGISASYTENTSVENTVFNTRQARFAPSLEFPVSEYGRVGVRVFATGDEITSVPAGSSPILAREAARGVLIGAGAGATYTYSTLDTGLNPDAGVLLRFSADVAGVGGDRQYVKPVALAVAERKIFKNEVTLRAIFEAGAHLSTGGDTSLITDRYTLNGKMRGFDTFGLGPRDTTAANNDPLGGNYFAVAKFEVEFPLGLPEEYGLSGGAFLDFGSVWNLEDTAGAGGPVDDSFHLRSAVGLSIFWDTPIGPLRFNFSKALQKQPYDIEREFDLTISTRF